MTSKYIASMLLASVLLMSVAVFSIQTADALKGSGSFIPKTRHKNVCGDQLCTVSGAKQMTKEKMTEKAMGEKMSGKQMMQKQMSVYQGWKTKTGTITSVQDPGVGHESHQLAIILPPSSSVYKGILTYDASENIQLVVLHGPLASGEDTGQAIWTPDGKTKFALTFVDPENSAGSWVFTGNALAVHTKNAKPFTTSYSISYVENQPTSTVKTGTITSVQDPGLGHESHQLAIILPPSDKTYTGVLTYSASENIQLVALHGPLAPDEDAGQKTWSLDENTKFALTFVDPENSMGTWVFSGNALAVHTKNTEPFTVSYSVVSGQ